jgi:hypothetical protein
LRYGGGAEIYVDGERINWGDKFFWRGMMIQDIPNCVLVQGYSKASWTLGADATAHTVCRLIKHLDHHKMSSATPRIPKEGMVEVSKAPGIMGLTSTYIVTGKHRVPKQSDSAPWKARGDYLQDMWVAKYGNLRPGLQFTSITM